MNKINSFQLTALIISAILGVGILSLPRRAAEGAGVDGVSSIVLAGIIFLFVTYLFSKFAQKFESKTVFEYSQDIVGKFVTSLIALLFTIYFFTIVMLQIRTVGNSVKQYLLFNTPIEVVIMTLILVCAIAVNLGLVLISRLVSNYYIFTLLALIIILLMSIPFFEIENLYPILTNSFGKISKTAIDLTFDYTGFEIILFAMPFLIKPKQAVKVSLLSVLIITILYIGTTIVCFGEFRLDPNQYIIMPTLVLSKAITLTGAGERIDILFMSFWMVQSFASISLMLYMGCFSLSKVVVQKSYRTFVFLSIPIIYILSLIPQSMADVIKVSDVIKYIAWFGVIPVVSLLLLLSFFKRKEA